MAPRTKSVKAKFTKEFLARYKKADVRIQNAFDKHLRLFDQNPNNPKLKNHALRNEWIGHRSINITSDWRAIYKGIREGKEMSAYFVTIGTHKELYK